MTCKLERVLKETHGFLRRAFETALCCVVITVEADRKPIIIMQDDLKCVILHEVNSFASVVNWMSL